MSEETTEAKVEEKAAEPVSAPIPEKSDNERDFRDDVVDWMHQIEEKLDAIGKAAAASLSVPKVEDKPAETVVQPSEEVAKETTAKSKKHAGFFW